MLFRFSKILTVVSALITIYFFDIYAYVNQLEPWTQPWVVKLIVFLGAWSLIIHTFNWICFGFFDHTLFMSKKKFDMKNQNKIDKSL